MDMEGLLQIAGQFHMGQLKKLTVKPFSAQTQAFLSKRNFDRHKIRSYSSCLLNITTTEAPDLIIRVKILIRIKFKKKLSICTSRRKFRHQFKKRGQIHDQGTWPQ
jgi:hypothetical protein